MTMTWRDEDAPQKVRILSYMREEAATRPGRKGWVGKTTREMTEALGIPEHDITHALYDLRKQGLIQFRESKAHKPRGSVGGTPRGGIPVRISVTGGRSEERWQAFLDGYETGVVGADDAHPVNEVLGPLLDADTVETDSGETFAIPTTGPGYVIDGQWTHERAAPLLLELPTISNLMRRSTAMQEAADLLASVGEDDAAALVRESIETQTRLDREVLELLRRLKDRGVEL